MSYRIGFGIDFHQLVEGRDLWIGGVRIPHRLGAKGHSDADVLLHAICDALLGAAGLRDIGFHFPDTDASLKNIDSKILLGKSNQLINDAGYSIVNIDSTIICEKPKILPYREKIASSLSEILTLPIDTISVKATTTEKMGALGRKEGVGVLSTVLLRKSIS
jgi:2-C-methyl-D-erythritol 2,4-cyclodiphosphate synthase